MVNGAPTTSVAIALPESSGEAGPMSTTPMTPRQILGQEISNALRSGASGPDLVELVIRSGWQPRPVPDPNTDYLEGVLESGRRVPIEIRHAVFSRVGWVASPRS